MYKIFFSALLFFNLFSAACAQSQVASQNNQTPVISPEQSSSIILPDRNDTQFSTTSNESKSQLDRRIWRSESAGFEIKWTTTDLIAESISDKNKVFSVRDFARRRFVQYVKSVIERKDLEKDEKAEILFYNRHFKLLSVVGTLVSFEDDLDAYSKIVKLPSNEYFAGRYRIESRFLTIDLTKPDGLVNLVEGEWATSEIDLTQPSKAVLLTDFFSEQDVLRALLNDAVIKRALSKAKKSKPPINLTELISQLEEQDLIAPNCVFYLPDDYLTRFAFHHIESNKVTVRLSLQPTIQSCRGQKAELGLLLPIPESLKQSLLLANSRTEGFLMQQQNKIAADHTTDVSLSSDAIK